MKPVSERKTARMGGGGTTRLVIRIGLAAVLATLIGAPAARADNWGVIFSGGINPDENHPGYAREAKRMWDIMTGTLNFPKENVFVLFADGTNTASDMSDGNDSYTQSLKAIETGGSNVFDGTRSSLQHVLETVRDFTNPDEDCFYFWSFDHGSNAKVPPGPAEQDEGLLCTWTPGWAGPGPDPEWVEDEVFAAWAGQIQAKKECYAFGQCFSGDMVQNAQGLDCSPGSDRFAAWSANWDEMAWGWEGAWHDRWAEAIEAGLRSTVNIGTYALLHDDYGPHGTDPAKKGKEHPGLAGENFHIVTNELVKDFGDCPDSYRTLWASDGPRYDEGVMQRLGVRWDCEPDGQPTPFADGDDVNLLGVGGPDDEDAVIFGSSWVEVTVGILRPGDNDYLLRAWWDLNRNGYFDHPFELVIDDLFILNPGTYVFHYDLSFDPALYYSRFRLTWMDDPLGWLEVDKDGNILDITADVKPWYEYVSINDDISHGEVEDYPPVPEPGTMALLGLGLVGALRRRRAGG